MTAPFSQCRESTWILHGPRSIPTTCPRRLCNFISKWLNPKALWATAYASPFWMCFAVVTRL